MPPKHSFRTWPSWILEVSEQLLFTLIKVIVYVGTLPYYRIFQFNTLKPILQIARYTSQPAQSSKLRYLIDRWRTRKLQELQFISIACAIDAAAVIGSFSWSAIPNSYWLASTFWYCSLVFAILGILLSAQQTAVLDLLGPPRIYSNSCSANADVRRYLPLMLTELRKSGSHTELSGLGTWKPRWKMVFTWQCPMMFMSYSVCLFLLGLTMVVCTPLIQGEEWSSASNIAVIYLGVAAIAGAVFMFCSFWVYHYVDLEHEADTIIDSESDLPITM